MVHTHCTCTLPLPMLASTPMMACIFSFEYRTEGWVVTGRQSVCTRIRRSPGDRGRGGMSTGKNRKKEGGREGGREGGMEREGGREGEK